MSTRNLKEASDIIVRWIEGAAKSIDPSNKPDFSSPKGPPVPSDRSLERIEADIALHPVVVAQAARAKGGALRKQAVAPAPPVPTENLPGETTEQLVYIAGVRAIQGQEGNSRCFNTKFSDQCNQPQCLWRGRCDKLE
jgi:hypothetical protein